MSKVMPEQVINPGTPNHKLPQPYQDPSLTQNQPQNSSQSPISTLYTEPKTLSEGFLACMMPICGSNKTSCTQIELTIFYKLKRKSDVQITKDYDDLFRRIWASLLNEQLEEIENERWQNFGFQNRNPRSDIRGGGLLALEQLVYFSENYSENARHMSDPGYQFFFGISSVNISFFLRKYYHMLEDHLIPKDKFKISGRKSFKSLMLILESDEQALNKIHGMLLIDLLIVWEEVKAKKQGITIMDFQKVIDLLTSKFVKANNGIIYRTFEELKQAYAKIPTKVPKKF